MIQKILCLVLPVLVGIGIKLFIDHKKGLLMKDCNFILIKYLSDENGKLYKWVMNIVQSVGNNYSIEELLFFNVFLENTKTNISNELNKSIKDINNLSDVFGLPKMSENKKKFINDIRYRVCLQTAIGNILNTKSFHETIAKIYMDSVSANMNHLKTLEKEYNDFSKEFGKEPDGDPILHPYESKNDAIESDEITEKSYTDLVGIGTAEDIE